MRPWGHFEWVMSRLTDKSMDFVGCVGTEDRCVVAYEELKRLGKCKRSFLVEVLDPGSDFSSDARKKRDLHKKRFLKVRTPTPTITPLELLVNEEDIVSWISTFLDSESLLLDISCLP